MAAKKTPAKKPTPTVARAEARATPATKPPTAAQQSTKVSLDSGDLEGRLTPGIIKATAEARALREAARSQTTTTPTTPPPLVSGDLAKLKEDSMSSPSYWKNGDTWKTVALVTIATILAATVYFQYDNKVARDAARDRFTQEQQAAPRADRMPTTTRDAGQQPSPEEAAAAAYATLGPPDDGRLVNHSIVDDPNRPAIRKCPDGSEPEMVAQEEGGDGGIHTRFRCPRSRQ